MNYNQNPLNYAKAITDENNTLYLSNLKICCIEVDNQILSPNYSFENSMTLKDIKMEVLFIFYQM